MRCQRSLAKARGCPALLGMTLVLLALSSCAQPSGPLPPSCFAPLKPALEVDLYFGRETDKGGEVSEADWAAFLAAEVTPRFADGLSVLDVAGQSREPSGRIARERSKLLIVVAVDAQA